MSGQRGHRQDSDGRLLFPEVGGALVEHVRKTQARGTRRSYGLPRLRVVVAVACALLAAPALAATQPWTLVIGRPELGDVPAGISKAPTPAQVVAHLGVLRREQNPKDRGVVAQQLLRHVGSEHVGVRVDSIRLVHGQDDTSALVFSDEALGGQGGPREEQEPVCVAFDGGGVCGDVTDLLAGRLLVRLGTRMLGLVPDGVQAVRIRSEGETVNVSVAENFFSTDRLLPLPAGPVHGGGIPEIEWLSESGAVKIVHK